MCFPSCFSRSSARSTASVHPAPTSAPAASQTPRHTVPLDVYLRDVKYTVPTNPNTNTLPHSSSRSKKLFQQGRDSNGKVIYTPPPRLPSHSERVTPSFDDTPPSPRVQGLQGKRMPSSLSLPPPVNGQEVVLPGALPESPIANSPSPVEAVPSPRNPYVIMQGDQPITIEVNPQITNMVRIHPTSRSPSRSPVDPSLRIDVLVKNAMLRGHKSFPSPIPSPSERTVSPSGPIGVRLQNPNYVPSPSSSQPVSPSNNDGVTLINVETLRARIQLDQVNVPSSSSTPSADRPFVPDSPHSYPASVTPTSNFPSPGSALDVIEEDPYEELLDIEDVAEDGRRNSLIDLSRSPTPPNSGDSDDDS